MPLGAAAPRGTLGLKGLVLKPRTGCNSARPGLAPYGTTTILRPTPDANWSRAWGYWFRGCGR